MKVALVRHYKVNKGLPENHRLSTDELVAWFQEYEELDITYGETDLNTIYLRKNKTFRPVEPALLTVKLKEPKKRRQATGLSTLR